MDRGITVGISYCRTEVKTRNRALALWGRLAEIGFTVKIDANKPHEVRWSDWVEQILACDKVIVLVDDSYVANLTRGVQLEYAWISSAIYRAGRNNATFIPVVFQDYQVDRMPVILFDLGYVALDGRDWGNFDELHSKLMGLQLLVAQPQPAEIALPAPAAVVAGLPPG